MVCNTAHYFYDELAAATDVPLLHMPRIAVNKLIETYPNEEKIGLIATRGTIADEIYKDEVEKVGREVELGGPEIQPMVDDLIYNHVKQTGKVDEELYYHILELMHDKYHVNVIILGCTELSLAQELAPNHPYNVVDPQSIIADVSIEVALKIRQGEPTDEVLQPYLK